MRDRFTIEWLETAQNDLREIVFYLIDKAPLLALGIQQEIEKQLMILEEFPNICQKNIYFPDVYDFKLKGLPYMISYQIFSADHKIEILAVLHERRNRALPDHFES